VRRVERQVSEKSNDRYRHGVDCQCCILNATKQPFVNIINCDAQEQTVARG
jgi:hypothetical protein